MIVAGARDEVYGLAAAIGRDVKLRGGRDVRIGQPWMNSAGRWLVFLDAEMPDGAALGVGVPVVVDGRVVWE